MEILWGHFFSFNVTFCDCMFVKLKFAFLGIISYTARSMTFWMEYFFVGSRISYKFYLKLFFLEEISSEIFTDSISSYFYVGVLYLISKKRESE